MKEKNKKGAFELSIGTIVVLVIAVSLLILGIVFIRGVMCSAVGLTGDVNEKVRAELGKLFSSTGGEVQCIGAGSEPVKFIAGKVNIVYCAIKAPETASYSIELQDIDVGASLKKESVKEWIISDSWGNVVTPGDEKPKKAIRIKIPKNAPSELITLHVVVKKNGEVLSSEDLDFEISRIGVLKGIMC